MPPRGFEALQPSGPFTADELRLPIVDRWTPLRVLLYPIAAAAVWLGLLPCVALVHLLTRTALRVSSLLSSTAPPGLFTSPTKPSTTSSLPPAFPLLPADAVWLSSSPYYPNVITAVLVLSAPLPYALLLERVDQRLLRAPGMERLRYVPDRERGEWVRNNAFELRDHIVVWPDWRTGSTEAGEERPLDAEGERSWSEERSCRALEGIVSAVISDPAQTSTGSPLLWSFALLPGYADGCVVLFRAHHVLADGVQLSGVLLEMLMDAQSTPDSSIPSSSSLLRPTASSSSPPSRFSRVVQRLSFLRLLLTTALLGPLQLLSASMHADDSNPFHSADDCASARKDVGWSVQPVALHRVKRISRFFGCSVNDVMMAVVVAALQRIAEEKGMSARESPWPQRVMHFVVPINIRPLLTAPAEPLSLGNLFSVLVLPFPLYCPSPRARLLEVTRRMNAVKRSVLPLMVFLALHLSVSLLPAFVAQSFIDVYYSLCTGIITNNRSPTQQRMSLCGRPLLSWVSWAPCGGALGLSVTVMSYAQEMRVSVVVDADVGVKGKDIIARYEEELARLESEVPQQFVHAPSEPQGSADQ